MSINRMSNEEFMDNVYDSLMKNTNYKQADFSIIDDKCFIENRNEIHIGNFTLILKEETDE